MLQVSWSPRQLEQDGRAFVPGREWETWEESKLWYRVMKVLSLSAGLGSSGM